VGLIIDAGEVLLIHQMTPPEPDCWDLPGGGLEPGEPLIDGLRREIQEETGLVDFQVNGLLTIVETFTPEANNGLLQALNIIYKCSVNERPVRLHSSDPEIGDRGIQWLPISQLSRQDCSSRAWKALEIAGMLQ
jgi:ADP-ribose pyrophosphatase YjhB (NUDIX family)